ncbi:MAG: hypothetical protein AAGA77_02575 [Bacteroidota bacterium]
MNRINPSFSFSAFKDPDNEKENETTYYFEVDENDNPIHLGDGSYGMVYRVSDQINSDPPGEFAVKIFYDSDEIEDRFRQELTFYQKIRRKILELGLNERITGLIEPKGGSRSFHKSKVAREYFKDAKYKISPYAIVMECYDGSLKDKLEVRDKDSKYTGYEALLNCTFEQRIKTMYNFIESMTNGLKYLYLDDNAHLDIKPANIYYIKRGINFEVVLADIGFFSPNNINKNPNLGTFKPRSEKERQQLLGSIHYRSPEQKSDMDKFQAKIVIDDALKVVITDPKFKDSIIEVGDRLIFSKYFAKQPHRIKDLQRSKENEPFKVEIQLDSDLNLKELIGEEQKTQVELRKIQRIRTDLFGIGAIAFDILTGGNSPERFYEKICSQDYESNSISKIIDKYTEVLDQSNDESEFLYIFNSFVENNQFASREIVEFILKCMLYKTEGTFYHEHSKVGNKCDYEVINEVRNYFSSTFQGDYADQIAFNANLNPIIVQHEVTNTASIHSETKLDEHLQQISEIPIHKYSERLFYGMKLFDAIIKYLEQDILNPNPSPENKKSYLTELRPEVLYMSENYKLRISLTAFPSRNKFMNGLKSHNAQNKLNTRSSHFFVPQEVVNFKRKVKLISTGKENGGYYYDFLDRSFHSDDFKENDFLVLPAKNTSTSSVFKISKVIEGDQKNIVNIDLVDGGEIGESTHKFDAGVFFYYRNLDTAYYMHMLATYLQHFFFANLGSNSKKLPRRIFEILYLNQEVNSGFENIKLKPIEEVLLDSEVKTANEKMLLEILYLVVQTYLGLVLNDKMHPSFAIGNINQLRGRFSELRKKTLNFLNIGEADFNQASVSLIKEKYENENVEIGSEFLSECNLEDMIANMLIDPNNNGVTGRLKSLFKKAKGVVSKINEKPMDDDNDDEQD